MSQFHDESLSGWVATLPFRIEDMSCVRFENIAVIGHQLEQGLPIIVSDHSRVNLIQSSCKSTFTSYQEPVDDGEMAFSILSR